MSDIKKRLIEEFSDKEYAHSYMDSFLIERISTQIYQLRLQRGITQEKLSEISGIAQARISLLEAGEFTSITMKTLRKLAEAFDVAITIKFESFAEAVEDFVSLSVETLQVATREESMLQLKTKINISEQLPNVNFEIFESYGITRKRVNKHHVHVLTDELIAKSIGITEGNRESSPSDRAAIREWYSRQCPTLKTNIPGGTLVQVFEPTETNIIVDEDDQCFEDFRGYKFSHFWQHTPIRTVK